MHYFIRKIISIYSKERTLYSDENANAEVSEEKQNFSKQKQSIKISSVMQILIEVMAERSEGVATNLTDKDFIDMLKLVGKR